MKDFDPFADSTYFMVYGLSVHGYYMPVIQFTRGKGKTRFTEEEVKTFYEQLKEDLELDDLGWQEIYIMRIEETRQKLGSHRPTAPVQGELF